MMRTSSQKLLVLIIITAIVMMVLVVALGISDLGGNKQEPSSVVLPKKEELSLDHIASFYQQPLSGSDAKSAISTSSESSGGEPPEYLIKTIFIHNFIRLVRWPGEPARRGNKLVNICFVGKDPFGSALRRIEEAPTFDLQFRILRNVSDEQISSCHVLFISNSEEGRLDALLNSVSQRSVLTISEIQGFNKRGGMIEFTCAQKKIGIFNKHRYGFNLNMKSATAAGLSVDVSLQKLADKTDF